MLNKIYWKEKLVLSSEKVGIQRFFFLNDGSKINLNQLKSCPVKITCNACEGKSEITYYHIVDKKKYICQVCNKKGNKNPFYGKKHTDRTKQSIANHNKGNKYWVGKKHKESSKEKISKYWKGKQVGDKNPFYGKKHDEKTIQTIIEKTRIWRQNLTDYEKQKLSKIRSESQKKITKNRSRSLS